MTKTRRLNVEVLEERDVPSASLYGTPWLDPEHLTLSLAPDGTDIAGTASQLGTVLANSGSTATTDLLRAFQSWAAVADINVGLVADGGQSFSTGGATQGDARFGDLRVGARPLSGDVLAVTSPFNYFNTYSGNVVFNSAASYDLFSVAIHEAGHSFGIDDNSDPTSVMDESYQGVRTGLAAADVAAIQALYGTRPADTYEGASGNNTLATATKYADAVTADLGQGDADYYRFSTPLLFPGTTIRLQAAGLSLLEARLTVFDAAGRVVATASASDPLHNDVTLQLTNLKPLSTYYVRVDGATDDVFAIGGYKLAIDNTLTSSLTNTVSLLSSELGVNDTLKTATNLVGKVVGLTGQTDFLVRASLNGNLDTDYYKITAPSSGGVLVATAWGLGANDLDPRIQVYDSSDHLIAAQVLTNDSGAFTVQVANAAAGQSYYLRVTSDSGKTGNYALSAVFRSDAIEFPMNAVGDLTTGGSATQAGMNVMKGQTTHFVLAADAVPGDPKATVTLTVLDANNQVAATLTTKAGDAQSLDVYLPAGLYTVQVTALTGSGLPGQNVHFMLRGIGMTDPVGAPPSDPNQNSAGGVSTGSPPGDGSGSGGTGTSGGTGSTGGTTTTGPGGVVVPPPPPDLTSRGFWSYWWKLTPADDVLWY
jgi:hypothetical protein